MNKGAITAIKDITESRALDKRRTGLYNELECYTVRTDDYYNKEQRLLNQRLKVVRKYKANVC